MTARAKRVLVGNYASGAWLVPLNGGQPRRLANAPEFTSAVAFSPSGERLAVGGGHHLEPPERYARVLDRDGGLLARLEEGSGEIVRGLLFLNEAELIVSTEGALRWWNTESGEVRLLKEGGHGGIFPGEKTFLTVAADGLWLYDRARLEGRKIESMGHAGLTTMAISPDGSFVVEGNADGQFWVKHFAEEQPHFLTGPEGQILNLQIDPEGHWIAALTSAGLLAYWPVPRGRPLHDRPLSEFLEILRAQTNIRMVVDPDDPRGYRETEVAFPGWKTAPSWQEWYSEEYMQDPPWTPMLDQRWLSEASSEAAKDGE